MKGTYISWMVGSFRILWTCLFTIGFHPPFTPKLGNTHLCLALDTLSYSALPWKSCHYLFKNKLLSSISWAHLICICYTLRTQQRKLKRSKKDRINFLISNANEFHNSNLLNCIYILCSFKPCLHHIILPINKPTWIWCI